MAEALIDQGHEVDLFCLQWEGEPAEDVVNGVHVYRLPESRHQGAGIFVYLWAYIRFFVMAAYHLWRAHRRKRYDLVQVHNPPDALVFATLPLKLGRVPIVLDLRELSPELFMSRFGVERRSLTVRILTFLERCACAFADEVIVLHDRHRRIMIGRGVPPSKMTQVMNCPDDRFFRADLVGPRRPPDGKFIVLCQGSIMERWGVDLLVEAIAQLRSKIPGLQLDLYGDGDAVPKIHQMVADLGISEIVRFHGQQPLERIPQAIRGADVGVAPVRQDVFTDCVLPTKLLECVALGLPSVASGIATTTDYFDDSMVLIFRPDDVEDLANKLLDVYRDPAAAQSRAATAMQFTRAHNWPGERMTYLALIERLAGDRK